MKSIISSFNQGLDGDMDNHLELRIYPNPTEGKFTLKLHAMQGYAKIELCNALGNVVRTLFVGKYDTAEIEFNISDVPSGIYFLKVSRPDSFKALKIVKISN